MAFDLMIRYRDDEPVFTHSVAAQLARVSLEFLQQCEQEGLIVARRMLGGISGFSRSDIRRLVRIRRLREDLGLEFEAVEIVLHLRQQVMDLLNEMDRIERNLLRREQELLNEIQELRRRVADEPHWRQL